MSCVMQSVQIGMSAGNASEATMRDNKTIPCALSKVVATIGLPSTTHSVFMAVGE